MDYKYIRELLNRYFECETTPSEERMLRAFFSGDDVPEEFVAYKAMFDAFDQESSLKVSPSFKADLLHRVGQTSSVVARPRQFSLRIYLRPLYNAVATIAIVMLAGHVAQAIFGDGTDEMDGANMANQTITDTIDTPNTIFIQPMKDGNQASIALDSLPAIHQQNK